MNSFFNSIGSFFESIFPALTAMGRSVNAIFMIIIALGALIWIFYGTKYKEPSKK
ncbi:MAG: hypothetical protein IT238_01860 [Bacteroidia bacterium]|nr:hypothetical protein [Bacteroidia bacterium]MCZ2247721.1 hypothetical protein [Bacteroidia bacterium]